MLEEARCDDVAVLDVRPRECSFTDFFVLATGRSAQHVFTAAHAVKYAVRCSCTHMSVPPWELDGLKVVEEGTLLSTHRRLCGWFGGFCTRGCACAARKATALPSPVHALHK